ncbi:hypothetical protein N7474_008895 [Penicillium riverlandense]|uniref:uncharacterized protein n=1 Tax=Penicillium riverlandense TaxID=1903569 RepID=UPI0025479DCF|nr:uncharacterized protein N7474_008895 [Penicillium riverlandense]KAJ5812594.1 hypothetical protein N7474_008895 [Penicillium riverlandense]
MALRPSLLSRWVSALSPPTPISLSSMRGLTVRRSHARLLQQASGTTRRSLTTAIRTPPRTTPLNRLFPSRQGLRPGRRFNSTGPKPQTEQEPTSLSARLKKLSREYGWAALGVYLGLSALDFPFCFAAVRLLGVDRIGHYEHVAIEFLKSTFGSAWPQLTKEEGQAEVAVATEDAQQGRLARADERNRGAEASIWTQLALAYAIHKSFIFIRVPLTAAVTPKVVKMLRRWGWNIGKRKPKSSS